MFFFFFFFGPTDEAPFLDGDLFWERVIGIITPEHSEKGSLSTEKKRKGFAQHSWSFTKRKFKLHKWKNSIALDCMNYISSGTVNLRNL